MYKGRQSAKNKRKKVIANVKSQERLRNEKVREEQKTRMKVRKKTSENVENGTRQVLEPNRINKTDTILSNDFVTSNNTLANGFTKGKMKNTPHRANQVKDTVSYHSIFHQVQFLLTVLSKIERYLSVSFGIVR